MLSVQQVCASTRIKASAKLQTENEDASYTQTVSFMWARSPQLIAEIFTSYFFHLRNLRRVNNYMHTVEHLLTWYTFLHLPCNYTQWFLENTMGILLSWCLGRTLGCRHQNQHLCRCAEDDKWGWGGSGELQRITGGEGGAESAGLWTQGYISGENESPFSRSVSLILSL